MGNRGREGKGEGKRRGRREGKERKKGGRGEKGRKIEREKRGERGEGKKRGRERGRRDGDGGGRARGADTSHPDVKLRDTTMILWTFMEFLLALLPANICFPARGSAYDKDLVLGIT